MQQRSSFGNNSNIPPSIEAKIGRNLHQQPGHPLQIIKDRIFRYFGGLSLKFVTLDNLDPRVSTEYNFDVLR
jgi:phenylalanyl-tRNA synthetase alpha chain